MRLEAGTDWFVIYTLYMYLYLYINTIPEHRTKLLKSTQFVTCNYGDTPSYYIMTRVYGSLVTQLLFIHFSHQFLSNYVPPGMLCSLHWHTSQRCSWDRWTPSQLPLRPYVNCQLVGLFFFTWVTMDTNLHAQLLHFFRMWIESTMLIYMKWVMANIVLMPNLTLGKRPGHTIHRIVSSCTREKRYCLKTISQQCYRPVMTNHLPFWARQNPG